MTDAQRRRAAGVAAALRSNAVGVALDSSPFSSPAEIDALAAAFGSAPDVAAKPLGANGLMFFTVGLSLVGGPDIVTGD